MVGGLVKTKQGRRGNEHLGKCETRLLATREHAHLLIDIIAFEEKGTEQRAHLRLRPSRRRMIELGEDGVAQIELLELMLGKVRELDMSTISD